MVAAGSGGGLEGLRDGLEVLGLLLEIGISSCLWKASLEGAPGKYIVLMAH